MNLHKEDTVRLCEIKGTCFQSKKLSSNVDDLKFWKKLYDELKEDGCISEIDESIRLVLIALSKEIKCLESKIYLTNKLFEAGEFSKNDSYYKTVLEVLDYCLEESDSFVQKMFKDGYVSRLINLNINSDGDNHIGFSSKVIESVVLFLPENTLCESHLNSIFSCLYVNLQSLKELKAACFAYKYTNEIDQKLLCFLNFINEILSCLPPVDIKFNKI